MANIKLFFSVKHRRLLAMVLSMAIVLTTISVAFVPVVAKAADSDSIGATGTAATQDWGNYTNSAPTATGSNTTFNSSWEGATEYNNKNEFFIRTAEDFNEFWYQATNGGKTYAGKTVRFSNNITLTGSVNTQNYKTWTAFQGTLDGDLGNGEMAIIYGMNRRTGDATQGGLFTASLNATIKNIVFKECDVFGWKGVSLLAQNAKDTTFENIHMWNCRVQNDDGNSYDFAGGFSAYAAGSTYRNCSYTGSNIQEAAKGTSSSYVYCGGRVTKSWGSENGWYGIAGAFVGQAEKSTSGKPITIENCYVNSNIQSRLGDVGGFVGLTTTDCQGVNINNSTMNGYVMATNYARSNIECFGGLIGRTQVPTTITSSVNNAVVKGKKSVGGIVGYSGNSITIQNSQNNGSVLSNNEYAGGFTGLQNNTGTKLYDKCYNKGNVFSDGAGTSVGGFVGNSSNATVQNSINLGEIKGQNYFGGIYGSMQNSTSVNVNNCLSVGNITRSSGSATNYGGIAGEYKGGTISNNYYANANSNIAIGGQDDTSVGSQKLIQDVTLGLGKYNKPISYIDQTFMNNLGITSIYVDSLSSADTANVGVKGNNIRGFQAGTSALTGTLVMKGKGLTTNGFSGTESTVSSLPYSVTATVDNNTNGTNDWIVASQSKGNSASGADYNVVFTVKTSNSADVPTDTPTVTVTGPDEFSETVTVTQNGNTFTGKIVLPIDGDYIFSYSYPGTLDSNVTQTVTAGKAITTSNLSVSSTPIIGTEVTITATVDDVEGVVDFENDATMTINGTQYPINSNGVVKFTPQNTNLNLIAFNFKGNDKNEASSATASFAAGKETPSILLSDQPESDYNGGVYSDAILDATVSHNFTADTSDVVYTYYVDSNCQTKTTSENSGAVSEGGAPAFAGNYWLQAVSVENDYYNKVATTKAFVINKAKITATVTTDGKVYDGTDTATGTVAVVGSVDSDGVALVVNNFKFDSSDAGNRTAIGLIAFAESQELNERNYEIDQSNSTFSNALIEKKEVTVSVTAKSKVYDGTNSAEFDSATITSLITADANDVIATATNLSFADANVGASKVVSVGNASLEGTKSGNYTIISAVAENADITAKQLSVTVNPIKIYEGQYIDGFNFDNFLSEIQVAGFVNGETIESLGNAYKAPVLSVDSSVNGVIAFPEKSVDATISDTSNGNYSYPSTVPFMLTCEKEYDVVAPTIVYGNGYVEDRWTAEDVEVVVSGSTADSGIARYEYSTDNGATWTEMTGTPEVGNSSNIESATLTITAEGKTEILFRAISNSGAEGASESSIVKIDKTAPSTITASYAENSFFEFLNNATFGLFFNETATVTLSASDVNGALDVSGVKGFSIAFDDEFLKDDITAQATDGTATFTIEPQFKGKFTVTATDNVGNEFAENGTSAFIVDAEKPIAPTIAFDNSYVADTWTDENVVVTVNGATADSGIAKYQYSTDGGTNWNEMTGTPEVDANPSNIISASLNVSSNGVTNVIFRAVSNSGVEGTESAPVTIKIDKTTPIIDIQSAYNFGNWTNNDIEINVANTADNESDIVFKYSTDGTTWVDVTDGKVTIATDTNANYKFKAISEAGIEVVSGEFTVKVQKTAPTTVDYSINPSTADGTNDWYKTKPTISVAGSANSTTSVPIASVSYKLYTGTTAPDTFTKVDGAMATSVVSADGKYTLVYFVTDEAGNNSVQTMKTFNVDTTAPEGITAKLSTDSLKDFLNSASFGLLFKDTADVKLTATDSSSDVEKFIVSFSNSKNPSMEQKTVVATDGTGTFSVEPQFVGNFKVVAVDKAGNQSAEAEAKNFAVDKTGATGTISVSTGDYLNGWTDKDVVVTVSGANADSGIAKYQYSTDDGATWKDMTDGVQTIPGTSTAPPTVTEASATVSNNGVTELVFRAVSNSGVEGTKTAPTTVKIDKIIPVIDVQSAYNFGSWTNNDVEIDVKNTANNESNVAVKYSTDGTTWLDVIDGNLSIKTDTNATYKFKAINDAGVETVSGDFTVKVQKTAPTTVDYSINPSTADGTNDWYKTKPTISVAGNANSITSAPIISVSYKLYTGTTAPDSFTKVDGTTATPVVSEDGAYTLVYFATDEAGNSSVETTKTFNVDTTAPTAEVAVKTSSFKEFISSVTFGIFLKDSAEVTIKSEDEVSGVSSVAYQKVAKGDSYNAYGTWTAYSAPIKVNANNEFAIYAKVTDKAGHVSIVNSNGIVVYTDSSLKNTEARFCPDENEVREGYEDVVVEMNLNGNTLKAITLDGKVLVEGTDYTVSENSVTLLKEYLAKVVKSDVQFTFSFNPMGEVYIDGGINQAPATAQFKVVKVTHVGVPQITSKFDQKTVYNKGDKANELKVDATTSIGELTYQWFLNGNAIEGATKATFVPSTETNGIFEYYVQVTSTDETVNGEQVSVVNSDVATIIVKNSEVALPVLPEGAPAITLVTDVEDLLNSNLTEEDKANLERGYDIKFVAEIKAKDDVAQVDKEALEKAVKGDVLDLFDISITKVIKDTKGFETSENITSLNKAVQFSVQIPDGQLVDGRTFSISRLHDGSVEELKDVDSKSNIYTFETDKFSAYALSYTDTEKPETIQPGTSTTDKPDATTKPTQVTKPGTTNTPATGDNSSNAPYYFAAISGVVLLAIVVEEIIRKKKAKENQDK